MGQGLYALTLNPVHACHRRTQNSTNASISGKMLEKFCSSLNIHCFISAWTVLVYLGAEFFSAPPPYYYYIFFPPEQPIDSRVHESAWRMGWKGCDLSFASVDSIFASMQQNAKYFLLKVRIPAGKRSPCWNVSGGEKIITAASFSSAATTVMARGDGGSKLSDCYRDDK